MKTKYRSKLGIPLGRAAQLHPFIDFLDELGAPIEVGFERNKLPLNLREYPEMLANVPAMFAFVADMARMEGIDEIGWRAPRLTQLSPHLLQQFNRSPTLLHALEEFCRDSRRESSHAEVWLEPRGDTRILCHRSSMEIGDIGSNEASMMQSVVLLSIVRTFAGPDWVPAEIGLPIQGQIGPIVRGALGDARIRQTPNYGWLHLPRSILALPPRTPGPLEPRPGMERGDEPAPDLFGSLVQLLHPYLSQKPPSIRDAADLAGTSVRTLQRELTRGGSSYRDVLQRVKFNAACELLKQPDTKLVEIAYATGFQNPPHFTRFFRRLAGMTPREYRATLSED